MKRIKKLILHIGVHKTGTTAIQSFLVANKNELAQQGYYVPVAFFGRENTPTGLRFSIIKKQADQTRDMLKNMVAIAEEESCHTIIVSDENYCKCGERDFEHVRIFSEFFEEVQVLMYCRRQDRELESRYGFQVTWEGSKLSKSPGEWFEFYKGRDYYQIVEYYKKQLTGSSTKVVSYDHHVKNLIDSFVDACGMEEMAYILPQKGESNITPNKYVIEVMSEINKFVLTDPLFLEIKDYVLNHELLQNGPKAIFYSDQERVFCHRIFEASNDKLSKEYYGGLPLFDEIEPALVPPGLEADVKRLVIDEVADVFHLIHKNGCEALDGIRRNFKIKESYWNADLYRELAIYCKSLHLHHTAYRFMFFAKHARPDGPMITKKLKLFKEDLKAQEKDQALENAAEKMRLNYLYQPIMDESRIKKSTSTFKKALKVFRFQPFYKIYFEMGLLCQAYYEIEAAMYFMNHARKCRPKDQAVAEKCREYQQLICKLGAKDRVERV